MGRQISIKLEKIGSTRRLNPGGKFLISVAAIFILGLILPFATDDTFVTAGQAESASSVGKWERLVLSFANTSYAGNPFELEMDAIFSHPQSGASLRLPGYYAGNDTWKVGFMPTRTGQWTYVTTSQDGDLNGKTASFTAVDSGNPGMLKAAAANSRKWKYSDGPYVAPLAFRFDVFQEDGTIQRFTRIADFLNDDVQGQMLEFTLRNQVYADASQRKLNLARWDRLEERMEVLAQRGLGVHLMLYSDDAQEPTWGARSPEERLLIRYLVARLAAYPVVIFNSGIDLAEYRDRAWVDWFGQQVRALDPYGHPVSSRYGGGSGNMVMAGQTFDSRGDRLAILEDMTSYFQAASIPVSMDDAWSENAPEAEKRGKDFSEHDIRRAIWKTVMAGGLGAIIRGSVFQNEDMWFRMADFETDLESEQYLKLINPFIAAKLGDTFGEMVPERSLVSSSGGKYALADPARTRILYFLMGRHDRYDSGDGGPITVRLGSLSAGYQAFWFDPRTGKETSIASLAGGRDHTLNPPSTDDWVLMLTQGPVAPPAINQAPTVNAGADQSITLPNAASLKGTASDDGLPNPAGALTLRWTKVSGPGTVTFSSATVLNTTASFSVAGDYALRLTASDSLLSSAAGVNVKVNPAPTGGLEVSNLTVSSGKAYQAMPGLAASNSVYIDRSYTYRSVPALVQGKTYLQTANDDKNRTDSSFLRLTVNQDVRVYVAYDKRATALPGWLSGWTDTGQTLANTDVPLALYSRDFATGNITLGGNLAAPAAGAGSNYTVVIEGKGGAANQAPVADAGADQTAQLMPPAIVALNGVVSDDGLPNPPGSVTTTWFKLSGPGTVTFGKTGSLSTTASFPVAGDYVLRLTANDGLRSSSDELAVTVNPAPAGPLAVSNLTVASGGAYQVLDGVNVGDSVYIDRSYTYSGVPAAIEGETFIQTANDDKYRTESAFLTFSVDRDVMVFVAYDSRARSLPGWLSGWTNTGQTLVNTDVPLNLYSRPFAAGPITLGGNMAASASGADSNYTVVVSAG